MRLGKTVRQLLSEIDSRELSEWIAFNTIDPITQDRGDAQAALICQVLANAWRGKGQRAFTVRDFMPDYGQQRKKLSNLQKFLMIPGLTIVRKKKAG